MKKKLAYIGLFLLAIYGVMWVHALNTNPVYADEVVSVSQSTTNPNLFTLVGIGDSMLPTMPNPSKSIIDVSLTPKEGDIVSFDCLNICYFDDGNDNDGHYDRNTGLIKRLIRIDKDNRWWVEGDNKQDSWDSRSFGWIAPSERTDVGVVVEILK